MYIEHSPSFERINMLIPKKTAQAGSDDPGDVSIVVQPSDQNEILIDSEVEKIFGTSIYSSIQDVLSKENVQKAKVEVHDHSALDFAIRARLMCALYRSAEEKYDWSKNDRNK